VLERLDSLLENLGAVRFEAETLDAVDPLIHVVVEEREQVDAPEGVIVQTVRPGFRTARGLVVCKAAVAVSRG
jgi:molecular chaperone GrpE (heat shock protein)